MSLFSNRLYTLRKENNLSQEELVDYRTGINIGSFFMLKIGPLSIKKFDFRG